MIKTDQFTAAGGRDSSHRIVIDYYHRNDLASDSSHFTVDLRHANLGENFNTATLLWVSVPSTIQNINDRNNQLFVDDGSTTGTITIPNGLYDGTTLADEIASTITANFSGTYDGAYDSVTNKITITRQAGTAWSIDQTSIANPLSYVAGLSLSASTASSGAGVLEFPNVAALIPPMIRLQVPELAIDFPIDFNVSQGAYALSANSYPTRYRTVVGRRTFAHQLTTRIVDLEGYLVDLQGAPVAFELLLE